jgi:hypothetical protein
VKNPANRPCYVACSDALATVAGTPRVHILGMACIRGQARRLVSPCDTPPRSDETARSREIPCIRTRTVALLGEKLTPSLEEGVNGFVFLRHGAAGVTDRALALRLELRI